MAANANDDDYIEIGGERLRVYSREHLEVQNPYAAFSDARLLQEFERYIEKVGDRTPLAILSMRRVLRDGPMVDGKDISGAVIRVGIHEGHMYGLGSSPQVSTEAYLLWAGAARLMERAGYAPDEPVRRKGEEPPKPTPPRTMRPGS